MQPKRTGFPFVEALPIVRGAAPGTSEPEKWTGYKLWMGDLWECQGCGAEVIAGVGRSPIAEHYQPDFAATVERYGATVQINDC